jgi:hypothetical protein
MELALQVVGLKMTGKIEDAKNVAMRIVGTTGEPAPSNSGDPNTMMQLSSTPSTRDIRPLLLRHARANQDFESLIVDFLSILDVPTSESKSVPISDAISYQTLSGQTLLHLASFLGFENLVKWLIAHEVDLDARDRNGYTPLHFAAVAKAVGCARVLVEAGADLEIVNVLGKTPAQVAPNGFFGDISGDEVLADDEDSSHSGESDQEEEERFRSQSQLSSRHPVSSPETSETDKPPGVLPENKKSIPPAMMNGGGTHSFVDMIHRTLTQFHAPQKIISHMPQLPLPHFPLPGIPPVPWGAFPQIPMMFPIFVPIPWWPSFKRGGNSDNKDVPQYIYATALRSAQDTWEKWIAIATRQQQEDSPPPMYTPRSSENDLPSVSQSREYDGNSEEEAESLTTPVRPLPMADRAARRFGYGVVPVTDQEVNAYAYRPTKSRNQKLQKKRECPRLYPFGDVDENVCR